ncbi:hypothetical protein V1514DRAFT_285131 [Lipomyces japonicus]|uniref:uncharacterized protein n=1 Tax=Lipomyces japonicus TaxID=56871 RepID=UPI0034CFE368
MSSSAAPGGGDGASSSSQDRRVYVGNLPYEVKWTQLKDFMRSAGEVLHADVLTLPNGMSKGCGVVEYATREDAQNAIATLTNQSLLGRNVYVREDRELTNRPSSYNTGGYSRYDSDYNAGGYSGSSGAPPPSAGNQVYVGNLPYSVGWPELKDFFRQAGNVIRADVQTGYDNRSKGSGVVAFENREDAQNAIARFNGFDWNGRPIEVREDRFAGRRSGGGYGRGSYQSGGYQSGDYGRQAHVSVPPNEFTDGAISGGNPSNTIHVRNLPWSTSNEDLVELFQTIGKVERAEIQFEPSGRSKGSGVVEFENQELADVAISKFSGYLYGNRPLGLSYVRYENAGPIDPAREGLNPVEDDPVL